MRLGRKISGGRYHKSRKKKLRERVGQRRILRIGEERRKKIRVRGGNKKIVLLKAKYINVNIGGKSERVEIKKVLTTPSNKFLARQNIITKGSILETEKGRVIVTNRPTQEGLVNGILIEKK
ncbi:MAG: 30S ribosomal protein S8e [Candidatus Pacearchaeota archaeon]